MLRQPAPWSCRRQRDRVPVLDEARRASQSGAWRWRAGEPAPRRTSRAAAPRTASDRSAWRAVRPVQESALLETLQSRRIVGEEPAGAWRDRTPPPRCRGSSAAGCAPGALRRFGHSGLTSTLVRPCSWPLTLAIAPRRSARRRRKRGRPDLRATGRPGPGVFTHIPRDRRQHDIRTLHHAAAEDHHIRVVGVDHRDDSRPNPPRPPVEQEHGKAILPRRGVDHLLGIQFREFPAGLLGQDRGKPPGEMIPDGGEETPAPMPPPRGSRGSRTSTAGPSQSTVRCPPRMPPTMPSVRSTSPRLMTPEPMPVPSACTRRCRTPRGSCRHSPMV